MATTRYQDGRKRRSPNKETPYRVGIGHIEETEIMTRTCTGTMYKRNKSYGHARAIRPLKKQIIDV